MIYSVNFLDLSDRINPLAFIKYLKATGWRQFQTKRTDIRVYQIERESDFFQAVVPLDKNLRDYKTAMYHAVKTVADAEQRPIEQMMLYLLNPNTDILKIRLDKKEVEAGNILFDDAISLYENTKKMIAAAAMDVIHPRKIHQGRPDDVVTKFLSECRFGQTEVGSYIVSVVCPFAELDEKKGYRQLSIFSEEEQCADSLTRKVTSRVMNNLFAIKSQIDKGETEPLVSGEGDSAISVNFYEALNGLTSDSDTADIEFTAEWDPAVKNNMCRTNHIRLSRDYGQPIETVISKIREAKNKATTIIGRIKKLESAPDVSQRKTGKITLIYLDDSDHKKTAVANLEKDEYDRAIEAHASGKYVEIVGDLAKGRNSTITCESFRVLD
ncbi:MAG: hypothetical protein LUG93_12885 [Lachnospiraceae bacterium]|nr:hypothetical protein [Lachnospiraceae bacterium]